MLEETIMKKSTSICLAWKIHYSIRAYKDNSTLEFNYNTLEIIKYIFTTVVLRKHFKHQVKTKKINNKKVIQNNPSTILDLLANNLEKSGLVEKYTCSDTFPNIAKIVLILSNILYKGFNKNYSIDDLICEKESTIQPVIEETKFLGHKRFNEKYDGYYIVQVKRNDDFDVLSVEKYNCTLQYEVITSYTKIRTSVIIENNLYVVFSPLQKKAYMYHVNKRGFRLICRIYNPNYVYQ